MKLEVGKTYKLNNGEVHECESMWCEDPLSVDEYGYGPFIIDDCRYHMNGVFGKGISKQWNVASCVDDTRSFINVTDTDDNGVKSYIENYTPTLWRDMTPEEKGALLLAHHEGNVIEWKVLNGSKWRDCPKAVGKYSDYAYRIKPEPKKPREFLISMDTMHVQSVPVGFKPDGSATSYIHVREVM